MDHRNVKPSFNPPRYLDGHPLAPAVAPHMHAEGEREGALRSLREVKKKLERTTEEALLRMARYKARKAEARGRTDAQGPCGKVGSLSRAQGIGV